MFILPLDIILKIFAFVDHWFTKDFHKEFLKGAIGTIKLSIFRILFEIFYIAGCVFIVIPIFEFIDRKIVYKHDLNTIKTFYLTFCLFRFDQLLMGHVNNYVGLRFMGFFFGIFLFPLLIFLDILKNLWYLLFVPNR